MFARKQKFIECFIMREWGYEENTKILRTVDLHVLCVIH